MWNRYTQCWDHMFPFPLYLDCLMNVISIVCLPLKWRSTQTNWKRIANEWTQTQIDTNMRVMGIMSKKNVDRERIWKKERRRRERAKTGEEGSLLCFLFVSWANGMIIKKTIFFFAIAPTKTTHITTIFVW